MTVPAQYNAVTLSMTPAEVASTGLALQFAADEVISAVNTINATLSNLELGWAGASATEAKDFIDQWTAAMTNLFGSQKGSSPGVLSQAVVALTTAGGNYADAEQSVVAMFTSLSGLLTSGSGGGSDTTPIPPGDSITDGSLSAVGESDWTALS